MACHALVRCEANKLLHVAQIPVFDAYVDDKIWHVRQAACLSMPSLFGRVSAELRRDRVVSGLRTFANDVSKNVRTAALEIIGEAIYMFKDDPEGVPPELLRFFLGQPMDASTGNEDTSGSFDDSFDRDTSGPDMPHTNSYNSMLSDFGFGQSWSSGALNGDHQRADSHWGPDWSFTQPGDPERPLVTAYNLPAVVLTIGAEHWPEVQKVHIDLSGNASPKVRRSLASSLHEVAKIIGPEASDTDLVPIFERFLQEEDREVKACVLENADSFLAALPRKTAEDQLRKIRELWYSSLGRDWRMRERLAQHIPSLASHFLLEDEEGNLVALMQLALSDSVSAVRDAGVRSVSLPSLLSFCCSTARSLTFTRHSRSLVSRPLRSM